MGTIILGLRPLSDLNLGLRPLSDLLPWAWRTFRRPKAAKDRQHRPKTAHRGPKTAHRGPESGTESGPRSPR